jgi:hypothetical protein
MSEPVRATIVGALRLDSDPPCRGDDRALLASGMA